MKGNSLIEDIDKFYDDYNRLAKNKAIPTELGDFEDRINYGHQEDGFFTICLFPDHTIDQNSYEFQFKVSTDDDTGNQSAVYSDVLCFNEGLSGEKVIQEGFDEFVSDYKRVVFQKHVRPEGIMGEMLVEIYSGRGEHYSYPLFYPECDCKDGLPHTFLFDYDYNRELNTHTFSYKGMS